MTKIKKLIEFKKELNQDFYTCIDAYREKKCNGHLVGVRSIKNYIVCENHVHKDDKIIIKELTTQDIFTLSIL